jgi:hypothetical protein
MRQTFSLSGAKFALKVTCQQVVGSSVLFVPVQPGLFNEKLFLIQNRGTAMSVHPLIQSRSSILRILILVTLGMNDIPLDVTKSWDLSAQCNQQY